MKKDSPTMLWHHDTRVNSHQRWKQMQNRVCFHLWCELTSTINVTEWQVSWNSWLVFWILILCLSFTFIVLVNSHQRWKQTRNRVCFHLWCELTLVSWCHSIVWSLFFHEIKLTEWQVWWNSRVACNQTLLDRGPLLLSHIAYLHDILTGLGHAVMK